MITCFCEPFRLPLMALQISLRSSPHSSSPFSFAAALTISVCHVLEARSHAYSSMSLCWYSKLLMAHTMSRILDLLISSLEKSRTSPASRSGRCFLHDQTRVTGFTEDHARYTPYTASNTVIFFNPIMLLSLLARVLRSAR
jgi:hypothetical protein